MPITIDAVYEDGVLKPIQPLQLSEHEKVRLTIHPSNSLVQDSYGLLHWSGDPNILRHIAEDDEFSLLES